MDKGLLILGVGGHGKVIEDIAISEGRWSDICFIDDNMGSMNEGKRKVIGRPFDLERLKKDFSNVVIAIGDNKRRLIFYEEVKKLGFSLPVMIHPTAYVSKSSEINEGTVIMPLAVVNSECKIGRVCILNTASTVDHDCTLGDGVHISPGVNIGGSTKIGAGTWICIGASISNNIVIGSNSIMAAGASVISNFGDSIMAAGVPARHKKKLVI